MKKQLTILLITALFTTLALAHGGAQHIMRVVKNTTKSSITVQTTNNETRDVTITDKTTFENAGAAAKVDDLKVGDRVVIHASKDGNKLVAHTVRFGAKK